MNLARKIISFLAGTIDMWPEHLKALLAVWLMIKGITAIYLCGKLFAYWAAAKALQ